MSKLVGGLLVVALAVVGYVALADVGEDDYTLQIVMPNAANLVAGSPVQIRGEQVGEIAELDTRDGQAVVTVTLREDRAPVHTGTKAQVEWKSLIGERVVSLTPGPDTNPELPSGAMLNAGTEQVELDQVLAALDADTRQHLTSTVQGLDATLKGSTGDVNETIKSAGPAIEALGQVLEAVGRDGPSIRNLVTNLKELTGPLADRQQSLAQTINDLTALTGSIAPEQQQLSDALSQLPATLDTAKTTLDTVPGVAGQTVPLLNDLRPATGQLKTVSRTLVPLLVDLRPTLADLGPTLDAANVLLQKTPTLLDSTHAVLPAVNTALTGLNPAVQFLRPYTPDLVGWLSNWGSAFAGYDARGHVFHGLVNLGTNSLNDNPGLPVGLTGGPSSTPAPGYASGQPWIDAHGGGIR